MSIAAITIFLDTTQTEIAVMGCHDFGGPGVHGIRLCEFLSGMVLVNGMRVGDERRLANGMGCLAAQVVAHFKDRPGQVYLWRAGATVVGNDYIYTVYGKIGDEPRVRCEDVYEKRIVFDDAASAVLKRGWG